MENKVYELSDEERDSDAEQRMPPPAIVPPVAKPKEKKQTSSKSSKSSVSDSGTENLPTKRSTRSKQPRPRLVIIKFNTNVDSIHSIRVFPLVDQTGAN